MGFRNRIVSLAFALCLCIGPAATQVVGRTIRPDVIDLGRTQCAFDISTIITDATRVGYDISQAVLDCSLEQGIELSCASDLTDLLRRITDAGAVISKTLVTCDEIGNLCTFTVISCVTILSKLANTLVAAAIDCVTDPFLCTYDVVTALDTANGFVVNVFATSICPAIQPPLVQKENYLSPVEVLEAEGVNSSEMHKFYERRLSETSAQVGTGGLDNITESIEKRFSFDGEVQKSMMDITHKYFGPMINAKTVEEQHKEMDKIRAELHLEVEQLRKRLSPKKQQLKGNRDIMDVAAALSKTADMLRERLRQNSPHKAGVGNATQKVKGLDMMV